MVGADLERLVSPHDQPGLAVLLVLEKSDLAGTTLLPLPGVTVETEQLGAHLERHLFGLLVGLGVDFLGEVNHGLEVYVDLLLRVGSFFVALDTRGLMSAFFCLWFWERA